jgi:hypothetical protein
MNLEFRGEWSLLASALLAGSLAVVAWLFYYRELRRRRDRFKFWLPTLRALTVFLVVLMLPQAMLIHRWTIGEMAKVHVFVDLSQSMELRDDSLGVDRRLMIARRMGMLENDPFDDDLGRARQLLRSAGDVAGRLKADEPGTGFHDGVDSFKGAMEDVFAELKKIGPAVWPEGAERRLEFASEVVEPARALASRARGTDPRVTHRQLLTLLGVSGRWQGVLDQTWTAHVKEVAAGGSEALEAAGKAAGEQSRLRRVEKYLLEAEKGIAARLAGTHQVELVYLRGDGALPFWSGSPDSADRLPSRFELPGTNGITDLSAPIRERVGDAEGSGKTAIVLISDGQHNSGNSPIELARLFGQRGVPIHSVGIGSTERPADVAVLEIDSQENVSREGRVRGEILLKDDMRAGIRFPLSIEHQGATLWSTNLETRMEGVRRIAFDFSVKEVAERMAAADRDVEFASQALKLTAVAGRISEDKDVANNKGDFRISVGNRKPRVLLLDGRPRWEFRYLRNLFERDDNWDVVTLLEGAGGAAGKWPRGEGVGKFPGTSEQLNQFDLVIFGDVSPGQFTAQDLTWLVEFVTVRGGGIIFVDGRRERLGSYSTTALGLLLPVKFRPGFPVFERLPMQFEVTAANDMLSPLNLTGDPARNAQVWGALRGPHWVAQVTAQPATETLANLVYGPNRLPAMVFHRVGSGKALYLGFDESWRWRFNVGDLYHQRFWNQVANSIMEPPFQVRGPYVAMDTGRLRYEPGNRAVIRVRPLQAALKRVPNPVVSLVLERDGKTIGTVPLVADAGGSGVYRGESPPLEAGDYETRVVIDGLAEGLIRARTGFSVGSKSRMETAQLHCNEPLLRDLARESGGTYIAEEDIDSLVSSLEPLSKGHLMEAQHPLWNSPWWFVPIVLVLGAEWFLRKRAGLV